MKISKKARENLEDAFYAIHDFNDSITFEEYTEYLKRNIIIQQILECVPEYDT